MTFRAVLQAVGLDDLNLWGDDSPTRMSERLDRLQRDLALCFHRLIRQRRSIEGIQQRLRTNDQRAARLTEQMDGLIHANDSRPAWKLAVELEQARRRVENDRIRLSEYEQVYQDQLGEFDHVKRRIADLQQRVVIEQHGPR